MARRTTVGSAMKGEQRAWPRGRRPPAKNDKSGQHRGHRWDAGFTQLTLDKSGDQTFVPRLVTIMMKGVMQQRARRQGQDKEHLHDKEQRQGCLHSLAKMLP